MTHKVDENAQMVAPSGESGVTPETMSATRGFALTGYWLVASTIMIVILDQVTKATVRSSLNLNESVAIVPGFLSFVHVRNTGVAFGLLNSADIPLKPVLMTTIALASLIALVFYAIRVTAKEPIARLSMALIIGGAIGNLIDRATAGYVIDFVDVYWGDWHFWAFNVADSAITVGAGLLILEMTFLRRHVSETV